jgi:hypothetical protein
LYIESSGERTSIGIDEDCPVENKWKAPNYLRKFPIEMRNQGWDQHDPRVLILWTKDNIVSCIGINISLSWWATESLKPIQQATAYIVSISNVPLTRPELSLI